MQQTIFSILKEDYKITKPVRLIEMFAGIGSQAKALKNLSKDFVNYKLIEIDNYCILSYNAIHGTNFHPQDITKIKGKDLEIVELDKYEYVLTYSFPCTDVSLAGKRQGMAKDSGTRSALLWEVERIMKELKELNQLPQILLMENVPHVINNDFNEWQSFLDSIGYSNYTEILNAKDYGIPQNRNRCFMVSIFGDYNYLFPPKQKLELRLKDFIEDEVDEKYYLSEKMIYKLIKQKNEMGGKDQQYVAVAERGRNNKQQLEISKNKEISNAITTVQKDSMIMEAKTFCINSKVNGKQPSLQKRIYDEEGISTAITCGFMPSIIQKPHDYNKSGTYKECPSITTSSWQDNNCLIQVGQLDGYESSGRIYDPKGICPTINTRGGGNTEPKIILKSKNKRLKSIINKIDFNANEPLNLDLYNQSISKISQTLTMPNHNSQALYNNYCIRKLTPKECWRLMGFSDEDFEKASKVNSNSQLYKQAGNSIVVNVLMEIFRRFYD